MTHEARIDRQQRAYAPPPAAGGGLNGLWLVLALQALLAVTFALRKGLVLDEFHALFHASATDLRELFSGLKLDNHPPASFLVVRLARSLFGESALALRSPQIVFGLATTWVVARTSARLGAPAWVAAAVWGLSSAALEFSTEVRMYALSTLAVAGAVHGLVGLLQDPASRRHGIAFLTWSTIGLHTHYYVVHYVVLAGLLLVGTWLLAPAHRAGAQAAIAWGAGALLLCVPWYLWGFREQFSSGLAPGDSRTGLGVAPEAWLHLTMWNVRLGGPRFSLAFVAAGGLGVALAAGGALRLARTDRTPVALLLGTLALGVSIWAAVLTTANPRLGFNWNYLLPSAGPLAVLVGVAAGSGAWWRRAAGAVVVIGALLTVLNIAAGGTEDYRGAIRSVLERFQGSAPYEAPEDDAVVCVEYQSRVFGQGLAWSYYAKRLIPSIEGPDGPGTKPLPPRQAMGCDYDVLDAEGLAARQRVFLIRRALPESMPIVQRLRASHPREQVESWGYGLFVHVFERGPEGP